MARSLTSTLDKLAASGKLDGFTKDKRTGTGNVVSLDLSSIHADPDQPRRTFDEDKLNALSDSIRAQGVLQPITVQPENADGMYLVIMGERRWRAAQLAGLTVIPAIVRDATSELRAIQLTENVQRADLTTMEIAQAVEHMRKNGKKRSEIAKALGWGQVQISQFAGILTMPDELQTLAKGNVSARSLSDLYSLWKQDERAARGFVSRTPVEDISRSSVAALRSEIAAIQDRLQPDSTALIPSQPVTLPEPADEDTREAGNIASISLAGSVAILCRHGEDIGRILTDRCPSSNKALMVSFSNGARVEEIALAEIELLEVVVL